MRANASDPFRREPARQLLRDPVGLWSALTAEGPPGTGKTFIASQAIASLLIAGKKIGIASNSHKAVVNLLIACGDAARQAGRRLEGIKVGGEAEDPVFSSNPGLGYVKDTGDAREAYTEGVVGGRPGSLPGRSGRRSSIFYSSMKPARLPLPMPSRWRDAQRTSCFSVTRCSSNNRCKVSIPGMPDCPRSNMR